MEYILFIHKNTSSSIQPEDWHTFFQRAGESGLFKGGSEIENRISLGDKPVQDITDSVGGFMRFESAELEPLLHLLESHPVVASGGSVELCEMPKR